MRGGGRWPAARLGRARTAATAPHAPPRPSPGGHALELFEEQRIYLVTQAANDLKITFVVNEEQGDRLVSRLHDVIVRNKPSDEVLGPTWEQIQGLVPVHPVGGPPWWQDRRPELERLAREQGCAYVYDRATKQRKARQLLELQGVERVLYAVKANAHPEILKDFAALRVRVGARGRRAPHARQPARSRSAGYGSSPWAASTFPRSR